MMKDVYSASTFDRRLPMDERRQRAIIRNKRHKKVNNVHHIKARRDQSLMTTLIFVILLSGATIFYVLYMY